MIIHQEFKGRSRQLIVVVDLVQHIQSPYWKSNKSQTFGFLRFENFIMYKDFFKTLELCK